ncbi:MAG: radical SAM protein [Candidatus Omnitrophica bacterium]|nr:radical SAM protein [Candidatus Omnitrophota bacterium]
MKKLIVAFIIITLILQSATTGLALRPIATTHSSIMPAQPRGGANSTPKLSSPGQLKKDLLEAIEVRTGSQNLRFNANVCVAGYCNLRCSICGLCVPKLPDDKAEIDPERYPNKEKTSQKIRFLNEACIESIFFTGSGEPILNEDALDAIIEIILGANATIIGLNTNLIWALDAEEAQRVLDRISTAFEQRKKDGRPIESFAIVASVDEFHAPNIRAFKNLLEIYFSNSRRLLLNEGIEQEFDIKVVVGKHTRQTFERLEDMVNSINDVRADFSEFYRALEDFPEKTTRRYIIWTNLCFVVRGNKVKVGTELMRMGLEGRAAENFSAGDGIPVQGKEHHTDRRIGIRPLPVMSEQTYYAMFIDADGSVSAAPRRASEESSILTTGHVSEGFAVVDKREENTPFIYAGRWIGVIEIKRLLEEIDPHCLKEWDDRKATTHNFEIILADDLLYTRLSIAILRQHMWDKITPNSRERIEHIEAAVHDYAVSVGKASSSGEPLNETFRSIYYDTQEDQLFQTTPPQPLLSLRGRLTIKDRKFYLNDRQISWDEETFGLYLTDLSMLVGNLLGNETGVLGYPIFPANLHSPLHSLLVFTSSPGSGVQELFLNALFSYLTDEELTMVRSEFITDQESAYIFWNYIAGHDIDIEIALDYYAATDKHQNLIQISIMNNRPLSARNRERIRRAFEIFRNTNNFAERIRLLEEAGIWTDLSGKGLIGFIQFLSINSGIFEFREGNGKTEQVVRIYDQSPVFSSQFINELEVVSAAADQVNRVSIALAASA